MEQKITTQPYKGTRDWLPEEFRIQKYIFDTWTEVCQKFGYRQYLTPLLEQADMYRAKSGVLKDELFTLKDRANRELALRPEMTPSVTRLVASIYKEAPKPLRLFSIANFFRNEAPQKGRLREFWQLNLDIFGEESLLADLEILTVSIEIMLAFGAPKNSFKLYFNNRVLLDEFIAKYIKSKVKKETLARLMDKFSKLSEVDFLESAKKDSLTDEEAASVVLYLNSNTYSFPKSFPDLVDGQGFKQVKFVESELYKLGYDGYFEFNPSIIRGLDYYNGIILEVFDLNPENNRSLFGGGRYNGLSEIFGVENFPATGVAPGNVTTEIFLQNWNLLPKSEENLVYCPLIENTNITEVLKISNELRRKGLNVVNDYNSKNIPEALRAANKKGYTKVLLLGENELKDATVTIKDLEGGSQITKPLAEFSL